MRSARYLAILLAVGLVTTAVWSWAPQAKQEKAGSPVATMPAVNAPSGAPGAPLSERVVAYEIDAKYDPATHTLDATETLTYHNLTGQPLDHFPFHLYLNGFQPKSTMAKEMKWNGGVRDSNDSKYDERNFGSNEIKSLEVVGMGDLTKEIKFIAPDDGNVDDRTVMEVKLPRAVPPGADVQFKIAFHAKFPKVIARTGYVRDFLLAGQWFPKVGVWWKSSGSSPNSDGRETQPGWNCHQFHTTTEFFADFGTYDVHITLPERFIVGATGVLTAEKKNADGSKTLNFHAEDVHDFAWTAAPDFTVMEDTVQLSTGATKIRILMSPSHMGSAARYMQSTKASMQKFDEWYGPYPYPQLTVVDPPAGGMSAGGMEYPMFITGDSVWGVPDSIKLFPEEVVEHEYGHQYWYGMVASNEFEDAWLDEGINSYTQAKVMDSIYGRHTSLFNSRFGLSGQRAEARLQYLDSAEMDPITRKAWQFVNSGSYGSISYGKTSTSLLTLEYIIGEDTMRKALHTYFMRYRFKHPTAQDFFKTVNEVAGQDLTWFWEQAFYGTQVLDDRILTMRSDRVDFAEKNPPAEKKGETVYHSQVVVHRKGTFLLPVTLEVKFDNGETLREKWDGNDRWHRFVWDRKAKLVSAEVDPDHLVSLDRERFNNSYTAEANSAAAHKLTRYWIIFSQWFGQMLAWLA